MPGAPSSGTPRESQENFRAGTGTGPVGLVFGENSFYRETWGTRRGRVTMLINVFLTPGKPIPKSNFRDGTWCELWVLLPPLPDWGPEPGENCFIEP